VVTTTRFGEARQTGTVSEQLAEHVAATRFEDLPSQVVEKAKDLLVYHLSLAFAARYSDHGRRAIALAHELSAGGGHSTIIGERRPATMLDAVFAHSELIDMRRDARHLPSKTCLGRVADPVAWILGEQQHASGSDLITALVVGYDASCKLGEAQPMHGDYTRVPHKCAFAPFATAAVAARLLLYDRARTAQAMCRAAHYGMGLNAGLEDSLAFSAIARSSVVGTLAPGGGDSILHAIEGSHGLYAALFGAVPADLESTLGTLGHQYSIVDTSTQPVPGSASHTAVIDAGRALVEIERPHVRDVQRVVATLPDELRGRFAYHESQMERATTARDRDDAAGRSLQLKLAVLLVDRLVTPQPTIDEFEDPTVRSVLSKVSLAFEPMPIDRARIEIAMNDGRTFHAEGVATPSPKGDWSAWLRTDGERFLSDVKLNKLEQLLAHLEDVGDVGEVLACTVPDLDEPPSRERLPD
jgi:2-methylcitrate dehydratase PrpD